MTSVLSWEVAERTTDATRVRLQGRLTESADFAPVLQAMRTSHAVLDLEGVTQINSCGVREWMHFVHALGQRVPQVDLVRVAPPMVRQINMISNFTGDTAVRSVMLPYYCESCGHEQTLTHVIGGGQEVPDEVRCEACGSRSEFDDLLETYLSFLDRGANRRR